MEFRILGPLEVHGEHGAVALGGVKPRAVLAVLLLHANEPVSAERLALALWGEESPPGAVKTVQVHVSRLRKALGGDDVVTTTPAGYRLSVRPGELDVERFEHMVDDGRRALEDGDPVHAAAVLRDALSLWRGPPLAELTFEPFVQGEIARLEEERLAALEARVEADLAAGRHAALVGELQSLVAANPTREHLAGQLMLALYRDGRQTEALEAYAGARRRLVADIGVEPGPDLRRLHEAILRHDASLELPHAVPELPRELDAATARRLVGREAELVRLRERWEQVQRGTGTLVTLIGAHGIGKTRLAAEVAGEAHDRGATLLYASGRDPPEVILTILGRARRATDPTLLVLDDADRAGGGPMADLHALARSLSASPVMVLATGEDADALRRLGPGEERTLPPLDVEAVRSIAADYAPTHARDDVPAEWLLDASGGIPSRVHEVSSQWARREAARKVGTAAGRAAAGRTELRSIEAELADDVVELQVARERDEAIEDKRDVVVCPFKGLASFDVADAEFFFGRERLVGEMVARLVGTPLLGIVGPSGSGKSSVLRAGLLPALAKGTLPGSEDWTLALLRPGLHPLTAFEQAVGAADRRTRLVIAVDQFEETFTLCPDDAERGAFVDALVTSARDGNRPSAAIIAVRADFYGRCADYPELSRLLGPNHVLVGRMQRDELRRAIELPAQRAGVRVESALVDRLMADVEGEPGALPLLSTALLELWQQRDGRRLTLAAHESTGGVRGAVARLAEAGYARLDPEQRPVAQSLLLRLADEGEGTDVVRRRVPLDQLDPKVYPVLDQLADARLVTVSEGAVEVAHEALLREWPRLRGWLGDDAAGRRLHHHLAKAAREWVAAGRDPGELYHGTRLAAALEWSRDHDDRVDPVEREFLTASDARRQRERAARRRRIRFAFAGLIAALAAISVVAIVAVYQGREADRQRDIAASRALAASSTATLTADPGLSLALARRAVETAPTALAVAALRQAVLDFRAVAVMRIGTAPVYGVDVDEDGRRIVAASSDGRLSTRNLADGREIWVARAHRGRAYSPRFSPDERTVASGGSDAVKLTDVATRRSRVVIPGVGATAMHVAFAPGGTQVAAGYDDGTIRLANTDGSGDARVLTGHRFPVSGVVFTDDGQWLASSSYDGTVRLWDLATAADPVVLRGDPGGIWSLDIDPAGRRLIGGDAHGRIHSWSIPDGHPAAMKIRAGNQPIYAARFNADGGRIAAAAEDGTVWVVDAASGATISTLRGHRGLTWDTRFSPSGDRLLSAGHDGTVRVWDPGGTRVIRGPVTQARLSPQGERLVAGGNDGTIRIWRTDGTRVGVLRGHNGYSFARFSNDGRHVVSASTDGTVKVWSASGKSAEHTFSDNGGQVYAAAFDRRARRVVSGGENGRVVIRSLAGGPPVVHTGHRGLVWDVAFSPEDQQVISAGDDATIRIWDALQASASPRVLRGHAGPVNSAAFSRDSARVVSAGDDATVRVWSLRDGSHVVLRGHDGPVQTAAFNHAGDRIVSAGRDGSVRVWDPRGGAPLVTLHQHQRSAVSAGFSPDGSYVLSAGADGEVRLSPCEVCGSLASVRQIAETRMNRPFTADERQRFLAPG